MALSLSKKTNAGTLGLDIDGGFVAAVNAVDGRVVRAYSAELPEGAVNDGEVADAEALTGSLRDFFKHHDLPKAVRLGVANQQIVVRQLDLPRIDAPEELDAAVRFQATDAIAMPLDEAVLDYQVTAVVQNADGVERMGVVVVAARRAMLERLVGAVRDAGLKPVGVDLDAFALVRVLDGDATDVTSARVHCHLGAVTNLAVAHGRACVFTRPLSGGWQSDDMGAAGAALANEISMSIDYYGAQVGACPVAEIVLSGPRAMQEGLLDATAATLAVPVTLADPQRVLGDAPLEAGEDPHRYAVAAGLALEEAA